MDIIFWLILGALGWSGFEKILDVIKKSSEKQIVKNPLISPPVENTVIKQEIPQQRQSRKYAVIEKPKINLSPEISLFLENLEQTNQNFFITGRAGTGKSTLLQYFRAITNKSVVVLAPTGVAAVNVQGQTIHSFFKFWIGITLDTVRKRYERYNIESKVYKNVQTIIIDEISMVRCDLLDCVEKFLRLNGPHPGKPFGGVQIIVVGDLYQLPPIVRKEEEQIFKTHYKSPFFFDAHCYKSANFSKVELTQVYRQTDNDFIELLDAIRVSKATSKHIDKINERVVNLDKKLSQDFAISLVTTNTTANQINLNELEKLPGIMKNYRGLIVDEFPERDLPAELELKLKEGSQVMLINNDPSGKWINGDLAQVLQLNDNTVRVLFEDGTFDDVVPYTWDKIRFVFNEEKNKIESAVVGSFTQIPVKLAWAVTIHKGQGKTFDRAIVDFGAGTFAAGQAYVALSRCRSMSGLSLTVPLQAEHIFHDARISEFLNISNKGNKQKKPKIRPKSIAKS